ncbi:MAG: AAA family ATPase [Intrasporangium sp.]|uniref:AAA family ATPase n=1 Tax=Intrasporangium sp. TaxID=1925024 RepID=UPI0026470406|nr:AAA family ATPase [Intrasporangium sp.]MDN5796979.1 AAA family ATPase [Intrasporangium sp.]
MNEPERAPIVSAQEMRSRLEALGLRPRDVSVASGPGAAPSSAPTGEPAPPTPFQRRCRERVVLLDYFSLDALRTTARKPPTPEAPSGPSLLGRVWRAIVGGTDDPGTTQDPTAPDPPELADLNGFVSRDCDLVMTRLGTGWRLRLPVRHETLGRLGVGGTLAVLSRPDAVAAAADDITHRMARRLLEGERDLSELSATELSGILRAVEWLTPLGLDLPAEPAVRVALDLANVLEPLRALAGPVFVGRERELGILEDHLSQPDHPPVIPLAIHGPGGIGKSTLLAHYVLDHVGRGPGGGGVRPLLFSYLSFDRLELDAQYPLTLLSEAARQICLQAPELVRPLAQVVREIDEILGAQSALRNEAAHSRGSSTRDAGRYQADAAIVAERFAEAVGSIAGSPPLLLVLDTFEMAQRRSRSFLWQLDDALQRMQLRLPTLRVVVAGRAPVEELTVRNLPLEGLDDEQSMALLTRALGTHHVDRRFIELVVDRVSGNPLSLRLAADLIIREGSRALGSGRGRRRLLYDLRAEQVQGVLYRRILDHVDKRVRPLASPGLVVRRITSDVIREVLAEPCGLGPQTPGQAAALFELLRHEVALVTEARPGLLVHRADVRREMLPLLTADDPGRVRDIHERAIAYYEKRTEIDDQIEHLYHRLMLGQPTETLDAHWQHAAATFLEDAWDELPPEARVYLAGRLGREADPSDLAAADRTAWIRQATSQARSLLDSGQPGQALQILEARPLVPRDLAVTRLVVEALASQGRDPEALDEASRAIAEADERGMPLEFLQLNLLAGRVAEDEAARTFADLSTFTRARNHYLEAREAALDFGARAEAMTAGVGVLRVMRRSTALQRDVALAELHAQLVAEASSLTERDKAMHPGLLRELAAELGDELPELLADAARHVGVETEGESASQLPAEAQEALRHAATAAPQSAEPGELPPPVGSAPGGWTWSWGHDEDEPGSRDPSPAPPPSQHTATSSQAGQSVAEAVQSAPRDEKLKRSLRDYWRSEADRPSFDYDAEGEGKGS